MPTSELTHDFIRFCMASGVLRFGQFTLKSGRVSPYFFNAGLFNDGQKLGQLAAFYAKVLISNDVQFDMIFGPAYKGIPLAATVAVELARLGKNVPLAYNRKEAKDHGEGGTTVGATLSGRVLIVDDVISAGTAVRESVAFIERAGARATSVVVAMDRQEKGADQVGDLSCSAVEYVRRVMGVDVCSIITLDDLLGFLQKTDDAALRSYSSAVASYREQYGVA